MPFLITSTDKLVCSRNETDRNARKSGSKKTFVNATLHLISGDRLRKANTQNFKYQCITHFCVQHNILLWFFFSVMKFVKSNRRATLKNEHLRELIRTVLTTHCADFCKTCILCHICIDTKLVCRSAVFLLFCKWLFY